MINPFNKFTRSQYLPSGNSGVPFMISNGVLMPNGDWTNASSALQNSDVYTVVSRISSDISLMKFKTNEPFLSVLNKPSKMISSFSFWQSVVAQMLLSGNSYVVISKDGKGVITGLELIPTQNVNVVLADNSADITYQVNYTDGRQTTIYTSDEMLHFRCFASGVGTDSQWVGVSPLMSLVNDLNISDYSKKLSLSTLKNAINPSAIITVPDAILSADNKNNIRNAYEAQMTGENSGRVMVLDQSAKLSTVSINSDILNFLNNANFSRDQVAKAFGVSSSYLNGSGDAQSSLDMAQNMYFTSLQTYMSSITSELELKLGVPVGLSIETLVDPTNQALFNNLIKLSTGVNPVFTPEQTQQILTDKGLI